MPQYVALLRGIAPMNPNMRNEKLRAVFEELGFTHVQTVIASGNVLFESPQTSIPELEAHIEAALPARLDFYSTTIIRSREQLQKLVDSQPFAGYVHNPKSYLTVTFLKHDAPKQIQLPDSRDYKTVAMYQREMCVVTDATTPHTPNLMAQVEKLLGKEITTRTWKTIERILTKYT
jgi:uncharacterized protein (DUF1697 family)